MTNISDISIIAPFGAAFLSESHLMLGGSKTTTHSGNSANRAKFNNADQSELYMLGWSYHITIALSLHLNCKSNTDPLIPLFWVA